MPEGQTIHRLYQLFADVLEYPTPKLASQAKECAELLLMESPKAAALMGGFHTFVERTSLDRLEELYTSTFDLQMVCYPYVGYHLFGESYKRGAFLAKLNEHYRAHGFSAGKELPDHVAVLLRFLAMDADEDFNSTLVSEGLVPALDEMVEAFGDKRNGYRQVVQALRLLLETDNHKSPGVGAGYQTGAKKKVAEMRP